jgi:hypothetical protein
MLKNMLGDQKLRKRGPSPALTDAEVLTILIVGEYLGLGNDKKIWATFKRRWNVWFPGLGCRTSFTRQSANLWAIQNKIQEELSSKLSENKDLFLFDGFPIPTCHIKRYKRSKLFKQEGAVGYCAAKDEKYFGFKGHLLITPEGVAKKLSVAAANIDERDVLPEVAEGIRGDVIADKGLIRPALTRELADQGLNLHTPLRKNMDDPRPRSFVNKIMDIRRKVETVIGQLAERFHIQAIRAKDTWHLMAKVGRKILAHTVCFFINQTVNPLAPLQLENLLA